MLGILVGKLDPSLQPGDGTEVVATATTSPAKPATPAPAAAVPAAAKTPVGVQQSPRTDGLRPHSTQPAKSTELPPLPGAAPVKIAKETPSATTRTRLDLPAGQATPPPASVATPAAVPAAPTAPAPAPAAPPAAAPVVAPPPPAPLEPPAASTPVPIQAVDPPDAPPAATAAPAATTAPGTPAKGGFAIQVAALTGANREAGAAEFQKKFKKDTGLDCQAVPAANGALKLMVTGFASKDAANVANVELKKKRPDLGSAYVVPQP